MKILENWKWIVMVLALSAVLVSCEKEPMEGEEMEGTENFEPNIVTNGSNGEDEDDDDEDHEEGIEFEFDCFEVDFPIEIQYPDGEVASYESEEAIEDALEEWCDNNPDASEEPVPVFPINAIDQDGNAFSISTNEELEALVIECEITEEIAEFDCFEFVYPIELILSEGVTQSVSTDEELISVLVDWYTNNPELDEEPTPVFPIEVITEEGENIIIDNEDDFEELLDACEGEDGDCEEDDEDEEDDDDEEEDDDDDDDDEDEDEDEDDEDEDDDCG